MGTPHGQYATGLCLRPHSAIRPGLCFPTPIDLHTTSHKMSHAIPPACRQLPSHACIAMHAHIQRIASHVRYMPWALARGTAGGGLISVFDRRCLKKLLVEGTCRAPRAGLDPGHKIEPGWKDFCDSSCTSGISVDKYPLILDNSPNSTQGGQQNFRVSPAIPRSRAIGARVGAHRCRPDAFHRHCVEK